jgi:hypothetical protein
VTYVQSPVVGTPSTLLGSPARPRRRMAVGELVLRAGIDARRRVRHAVLGPVRRSLARGDRGDVPGWVLVTLMTAGLVLVLWGVARERLTQVFNDAIDNVVGGG